MWRDPDEIPVLQAGLVYVWRVQVTDFSACLPALHSLLDKAEQERVHRFIFERHRLAYLVMHGALRILLGHYLGLPPRQVCFAYNPNGKPSLDFGRLSISAVPDFQFNISESSGVGLMAFGLCGELGVDVEAWRPQVDFERLAQRFFAPPESQALLSLPEEQRQAAFFDGWTRKEAYMKARGLGFALPLDDFVVALRPGEAPCLLQTREAGVNVREWHILALQPGEGLAGALAVHGAARLETLAFTPRRLTA